MALKRSVLIPVAALLLAGGSLLALSLTTSQPGDPENYRYRLWKAGFPTLDLDIAADTMIGDPDRDKLVIGKTPDQLRDRFGYLTELAQASPYLRNCYLSSGWSGKTVMFIRKSPWMVVFDNGHASELVLIKGC